MEQSASNDAPARGQSPDPSLALYGAVRLSGSVNADGSDNALRLQSQEVPSLYVSEAVFSSEQQQVLRTFELAPTWHTPSHSPSGTLPIPRKIMEEN